MIVRPERLDDFPVVDHVVAAAFASSAEATLVRAIRDSTAYRPDLSLVAELDRTVVGHVMVSEASIHGADDGRHDVLVLSPLAVSPQHQGGGIGAQLVRAAIDRAIVAGGWAMVLQGDPAYYGRFGFVPAIAHGITMDLPDWAPIEAAQILPLHAFDSDRPGHLVLPDHFDGLD